MSLVLGYLASGKSAGDIVEGYLQALKKHGEPVPPDDDSLVASLKSRCGTRKLRCSLKERPVTASYGFGCFTLPGRGGPFGRSICLQSMLEKVLRSPVTREVVSQETEAPPLPVMVLPPKKSPTEMRWM